MNNLKLWYCKNQTEITWFIIGFLVFSGMQDLSIGNYVGATISFVLAYINYGLNK